jgi:hypothetical protein
VDTSQPAVFPPRRRSDVLALWGGIAFCVGFTALISLLGERLAAVPHLPDEGASWYYWKLPEPTFAGRLTAWGFYVLHQVTLWGLIAWAQRQRPGYTGGLHRVNVLALGANAFFVLLHLVQTHVWYDGLAQDVSIWSSLGSVAFLLIWVLLMENPRRGLFFGRPLPLSREVMDFTRRTYGYVFSWAVIYTFWYHPTEPSSGHLVGFFYTLLLLLQGSLFFSPVHRNRWWTLALEVLVLVHGTLVAMMQGNQMWPMFAFGFGGIFVLTQMHGLGLSRMTRTALLGAYLAGVAGVYGGTRGWSHVHEVLRIPFIDYAAVLLLAGLLGGGLRVARSQRRRGA